MTERHVYKRVDGHDLALHVFRSQVTNGDGPAIVFFFGGGWRMGTVNQFAPHAHYFAARGLMCFVADYRVSSRHGTTPYESVFDARSAMRWVRSHASHFGVDPERIVASGGSVGGHLAACTALTDGPDQPGDGVTISPRPTALVLFNPVLDLIPFSAKHAELQETDYLRISPFHNITAGSPPAIIFHGTADELVDFDCSQRFCHAYEQAGNRCDLHGYEGEGHGFFNLGRSRTAFVNTVARADRFLTDLGLLEDQPDVPLLHSIPADTHIDLVS